VPRVALPSAGDLQGEPRNAAAGTLRAKDPATVAERRLRFFAFDLDTDPDSAETDLDRALRTLGFTAADMRHCADADADAAQTVIAAIEQQRNTLDYDLDGAVLRLADHLMINEGPAYLIPVAVIDHASTSIVDRSKPTQWITA
jgi:NAD-dependent DNA ligase